MTPGSRGLCAAYAWAFVWLAYCAVVSAHHGAWWAAGLFVAASLGMFMAVVRETALADARDYAAGLSRALARHRKDQP